jgi:transposase-like protein
MTETLVAVTSPSRKKKSKRTVSTVLEAAPEVPASCRRRACAVAGAGELARELVRRAQASGVALTSQGKLLKSGTKLVSETTLEEETSAHHGASVSKETVSGIADKVIEEMNDWPARPLDEIYVAIFIDAIAVKVRDGQVANRTIYAAIGVILEGGKDILGLWAGTGGEGAKFWMAVLTDIRNKGTKDVFFVVTCP